MNQSSNHHLMECQPRVLYVTPLKNFVPGSVTEKKLSRRRSGTPANPKPKQRPKQKRTWDRRPVGNVDLGGQVGHFGKIRAANKQQTTPKSQQTTTNNRKNTNDNKQQTTNHLFLEFIHIDTSILG